MKKLFLAILVFGVLLTACKDGGLSIDTGESTDNGGSSESPGGDSSVSTAAPVVVDFSKTDSDMFSDRDLEVGYNEDTAVRIELGKDSVTASSDSVKINGTTVKITEEATYVITGTLSDGVIAVDASDKAKIRIVLAGASVTSSSWAPLYIINCDKTFVTLAPDTENSLVNGGAFTAFDDSSVDGALFSKQDLTLNGSGSLTVTSPVGKGIVCKDDLVITGGTYSVTAASHGIDANDSVRISGAKVTAAAGKDGIHTENADDADLGFVYVSSGIFDIDAEGDGISAGAYLQICNGEVDILAGGGSENGYKQSSDGWGDIPGGMGGERPGKLRNNISDFSASATDDTGTSMKGIKAASGILISDGVININSADDAVHSDMSVTINGGTFTIATGDDGIHAEETFVVTAGDITISESYEGLEAHDIALKGGKISLTSRDDGLNAAGGNDSSGTDGGRDGMFGGGMPGGMSKGDGSVVISGGNLYVNASGDGIDANGYIEISGGYTVVCGPTRGDTAVIDYDTTATIKSGTFIGTGASGMAQTFSDYEQGVLAMRVGNQSAGTKITLADDDGRLLIEYLPDLDFAVVILSCPDMIIGENYTVSVGSASQTFKAE